MKEILLTRGKTAMVDDADFASLSRYRWHAIRTGATWYARRTSPNGDGTYAYTLMHREVFGAIEGIEVDHEDGNGLNNRRSNLRAATSQQNKRNRTRKSPGKTSRFKGVFWHQGRWHAVIRAGEALPNGRSRQIWLGGHAIEEEAARTYDAAARLHFGAFASTNFAEVC
jgi:hypothetical protein